MNMTALNSEETALILIEYQNEWISKQGQLRKTLIKDEEQFESAIENSKVVLKKARHNKYHIVHVLMKPNLNCSVFGLASLGLNAAIPKAKTWQGSCSDIHCDFSPEPNELVVSERIGVSAFSASCLDAYLRNNRISNVIIIGFATHVCVESTLRESHDRGYNTYVVTEATGAFTNEQKDYFSRNIVHHFDKEIKISDWL
ncbi:cysteine hydrolase [Vibrio sp.]|nr:cysteine hydrolase [Vibrio sp.]